VQSTEDIVLRATQAAEKNGFGRPGEALLIIAGTPFGVSGTTNLLRIAWIGDAPATV
jgi:pyruvate kinase